MHLKCLVSCVFLSFYPHDNYEMEEQPHRKEMCVPGGPQDSCLVTTIHGIYKVSRDLMAYSMSPSIK